MRERILKFIESERITAAEFADKIGVQRSSVSHVLNGRNNPGFAFIQKILEAFPSIDSRWLLTGSGKMYESSTSSIPVAKTKSDLFSTTELNSEKETVRDFPASTSIKNTVTEEKQPIQQVQLPISTSEKTVDRVLIFYSDHTFEDFRPAK